MGIMQIKEDNPNFFILRKLGVILLQFSTVTNVFLRFS